MGSLKEPVGIVFSEESRESASKSTEPDSQGLGFYFLGPVCILCS